MNNVNLNKTRTLRQNKNSFHGEYPKNIDHDQ